MKKLLLILIVSVSLFLVGCGTCDEGCYDKKIKYEEMKHLNNLSKKDCPGLIVYGNCYNNVVEYCHDISEKSGRDYERTEQQRRGYKYCVEINTPLFE